MIDTRWRRVAALFAISAILFAPSVWFVNTVPPLWRDIDAYTQLTKEPSTSTILGHAPLYCFAARVPLFLGYHLERMRGRAEPLTENFFVRPRLTDTGIALLLLLQHAALCLASLLLISTISPLFAVRAALAVAWVLNPLFYSFAHCVGSETLSMICILLVTAVALRIVQRGGKASLRCWSALLLLLWLAILARHVNNLLILLLPLAFATLLLWHGARFLFAPARRMGALFRLRMMRHARSLLLAVVVGVIALALANGTSRSLAAAAGLKYRSKIGYTFLWRLQFLNALTLEERAAVLAQASAAADTEKSRKLIALFGEQLATGPVNAAAFALAARGALFELGDRSAHFRLDLELNRMVEAFLDPPHPLYREAVARDFRRARETSLGSVTEWLFIATAFYFDHADRMPLAARLVTFRNSSAEATVAIPAQHRYLRVGSALSYNTAILAWAGLLLAFVLCSARSTSSSRPIVAYAVALTAIGLVMMLASNLFGEFLPRYALPMWTLLIASAFMLMGAIGTAILKNYGPALSRIGEVLRRRSARPAKIQNGIFTR